MWIHAGPKYSKPWSCTSEGSESTLSAGAAAEPSARGRPRGPWRAVGEGAQGSHIPHESVLETEAEIIYFTSAADQLRAHCDRDI